MNQVDKISGEEKAKATAEIENVKKALEGSDIDKIKEATEKLKQAFYAMSEKLYAQANPNGAAGAGANAGAGAGPQTDANGNVYNADYKVEDEQKRRKQIIKIRPNRDAPFWAIFLNGFSPPTGSPYWAEKDNCRKGESNG